MAVMFASSILVVTAGAMLVPLFRGYRAGREAAATLQDQSAAIEKIRNELRRSSRYGIEISTNWIRAGVRTGTSPAVTNAIFRQGFDLVYDADVAQPGGQFTLVKGRLVGFSPSLSNSMLHLTLSLRYQYSTTAVRSVVHLRNSPGF
jgi:hypothetical protein